MKRSEMLKLMAKACCDDNIEKGTKIEVIMDAILIAQEKAGMLPPHRAVLSANPNIKTSKDMIELPALIIKDETTWESESDVINND